MSGLILAENKPLGLIVLAGGAGERMKREKALLPVPGGTVIEGLLAQLEQVFDEVIISVSKEHHLTFLRFPLVVDPEPRQGPMMGIRTALRSARNEKNFVIACDIPAADVEFIRKMARISEGFDIVVPVSPGNRPEPLFAIYSKSVLPKMNALLERGVRSLLPLLEECRTRKVEMTEAPWFRNLNTPADYEEYLKSLRSKP